MKFRLTVLFCILGSRVISQDYQLKLNDTILNMAVGKNYEVYLNGKAIKLSLTLKDTLQFDNGVFSFQYPKEYAPSKQMVDSTAEQFTIITAGGSGIIIQHYFSINPESINELMLQEITKKNIDYGYKEKREDYERTLPSGQLIKVIKAVLTYKDDLYTYEVASIGKKDEGLAIITLNLGDKSGQGEKIINLLWNSLKY